MAAWYPKLFGVRFLPLKRGIFQDLLEAHPAELSPDALKAALAQHTRATRYLAAVAQGLARHDLQGLPVEAMAPEHVHHALLEVFRRRQAREGDGPQPWLRQAPRGGARKLAEGPAFSQDLTQTLRQRMVQAFERSGLTPDAYAARVRGRDEASNALLEAALADARAGAARNEALLRAFESAAATVAAFADMYGMDPRAVAQTLERARHARAAVEPANAAP